MHVRFALTLPFEDGPRHQFLTRLPKFLPLVPRPAATNDRHADPFGDMGMFDKPPEFKTKRRRSETSRLGVMSMLHSFVVPCPRRC